MEDAPPQVATHTSPALAGYVGKLQRGEIRPPPVVTHIGLLPITFEHGRAVFDLEVDLNQSRRLTNRQCAACGYF
jgi:hypothetical protein